MLTELAALALDNRDLVLNVLRLEEDGQAKFIDSMDQTYPALDLGNARFIWALGDVCGVTGRLPTSSQLSATELNICDNEPYAIKPIVDMWNGKHLSTKVSVNAFRFHSLQNVGKAKEILWKRVPTWVRLAHENILPFRGVDLDHFPLALVFDWVGDSDVNQHIRFNPNASRMGLLIDVASGLKYLHQLGIPHGDLTGANVIVDLNGRARLAGYGLVPINSDPAFTISGNSESLANSRWLAPEIMEPPRRRNVTAMRESKAADVFAFGMLAVEVFTGEVPFVGQGDGAVIFQILRGERPKMPENAQEVGLTVEMWNLIESCWKQNPKKRPTIGEVLVKLQELFSDTKDNSNDLEDAQPVAEPAAGAVRQTISEAFRRIRMAIQPRRVSEAVHLGTITNSEWATLSVKRQNPEFSDQTLTPSQLFSLTLSQDLRIRSGLAGCSDLLFWVCAM